MGPVFPSWRPHAATRSLSSALVQSPPRLGAAGEPIGLRNKDRPESRRAFAAKGAAYLQRGIGLIGVDTVTSRHFNLHNELAQLLGWAAPLQMPNDAFLYAVAYRPARRQE